MNWDSRRVHAEMIWEAFAAEGKKSIMLNYCEAWPPRTEDENSIFIDGTGVVPFLRSSVQFQKVVKMKADYPTMKDIPHVVNQSSADCVVYNDQVEKFGKNDANDAAAAMPQMSKEDLEAAMTGCHFTKDMPLESEAFVIKGMSAEEAGNSDSTDTLYTPIKDAEGWAFEIPEGAKEATITMNNSLQRRYALKRVQVGFGVGRGIVGEQYVRINEVAGI